MDELTSQKIKILFVDDEPKVIDGLRRMLFSQRKIWDMYFVYSGKEALELLSNTPIDIIISDMRMPNMSGSELLNIVQEKYPNIIRLILSGHSDEEMILHSVRTAHQFLTKPCTAQQLIDTINKAINLKNFLRSEKLLETINAIEELPTIPELYLQIENELNQNNISISKIIKLISDDISISAKVLQVVNSGFFMTTRQIGDIPTAVNLLGTNIIKSIILYLNFQKHYDSSFQKYLSFEKLWEHSNKVATLAKNIYQLETKNALIAKEAYSAGILHDIGKIILLKNKDFIKQLEQNNLSFNLESELKILGVSHAYVGAYLLGIWNLPNSIVNAVANHHDYSNFEPLNISCYIYYANILVKENRDEYIQNDDFLKTKIDAWKNFL